MLVLVFYVPATHLDVVKDALFSAGAGKIGDYEACCWQVKGQGQFRPIDGANPYIGQNGVLEVLEEYRVEMVLSDSIKDQCVVALKAAHPYEEVAYHLLPTMI